MGFFVRDSRTIRNSRGKQAISVQATEVLLYIQNYAPLYGTANKI